MKKYDSYKDSGIEWIGKIPSHWKVNKVKYNFSFRTGFTPPSGKSEYYENGRHVWINIRDLSETYVSDSTNKITDKAIKDLKPTIVPKNWRIVAESEGKKRYKKLKTNTLWAILLSFPIVLLSMVFMNVPYANEIMALLATPVVLYFGRGFFVNAWK